MSSDETPMPSDGPAGAITEPAAAGSLPDAASAPGESVRPVPFDVADGKERTADPRHITLERIQGAISGAALLAGSLVACALLGLALEGSRILLALLPVAGAAGLTLLMVWWPGYVHPHNRWRLDERGLRIFRGALFRREIDVPRSRVQHTDVAQGPLARRLGLATLLVHTAGTMASTVALPGLPAEVARAIRDRLVDDRTGEAPAPPPPAADGS